jgi:hypothetical protein
LGIGLSGIGGIAEDSIVQVAMDNWLELYICGATCAIITRNSLIVAQLVQQLDDTMRFLLGHWPE